VIPLADIRVIDARPEHAVSLAKTMRETDVLELKRLGYTPYQGLMLSCRSSIVKKTALIDGVVVAMFGASGDLLSPAVHPWLLSSDCVAKYPLVTASIYRKEIKSMVKIFGVLNGFVLASYENYLRLLKLVGFSISAPEAYGNNGELFCRFEMRA